MQSNSTLSRRIPALVPAMLLPLSVALGLMASSVRATSVKPIAYVRDDNIWVMSDPSAAGGGIHTQLTSGKTDTTPTWSPTRNRIAFVRNNVLWVMYADGSSPYSLNQEGWGPEWSPNSEKIVFTSGRDGDMEIYVVNADGNGLQKLTNNATDDHWPTWSPNGNMIGFTASRNGQGGIYVMDANTPGSDGLLLPGAAIDAVWSPAIAPLQNGATSRIAFLKGDDVWVTEIVDHNGTAAGLSAYDAFALTTNRKLDTFPTWSPDGDEIAFQTDRPTRDIYRMLGSRPEGATNPPRPLATSNAWDMRPAWDD